MTEGLPGSFAENFVDQVMEKVTDATPDPQWGTWEAFAKELEATFAEKNKKQTAQQELVSFCQAGRTAEEFFQQFDQLCRKAGYHTGHDEFLIELIKTAVHESLVRKVFSMEKLPDTYALWKEKILLFDKAERQFKSILQSRGSSSSSPSNKPRNDPPKPRFIPRPYYPPPQQQPRRDNTGVVYGGRGQRMDVDAAKTAKACFNCGEAGHFVKDCKKPKKMNVRSLVSNLTEEQAAEMIEELDNRYKQQQENFGNAQQ